MLAGFDFFFALEVSMSFSLKKPFYTNLSMIFPKRPPHRA
jgi:hypothetical protein